MIYRIRINCLTLLGFIGRMVTVMVLKQDWGLRPAVEWRSDRRYIHTYLGE